MKGYGFVDYVTQGYLAAVALLVIGFHNQTVPAWGWLVAGHGGVMLMIHGLIRRHGRGQPGPVLDFLRHFYPVLLYTGFYRETAVLNRMFQTDYLDPVLIRWEQALFGGQPSVQFMELLPWRATSELFYAAYFSYYVMIVGVGLTLLVRRRDQFHHYVSIISFVFYVCYLTYIFVPVTGPRAFFREVRGYRLPAEVQALVGPVTYPEAVTRAVFYQIMAVIYDIFEVPGAALPSSHVAVAVATAWFSFRYLPRIRFWHLGTVFLLCLSTVYCRYHYVIDVLAGLLTAAVLVPLGHWLYERCAGAAPQLEGPAGGQPAEQSPQHRPSQSALAPGHAAVVGSER